MKPIIGSFQLMKSLNRSIILNTIRNRGPISRAEIAQLTQLTPPTVGNIVKELIEAEMVLESEQGESRGGRKPTMLIINPNHFNVIGLDVGPNHIKVIYTNLTATILSDLTIDLPSRMTNEMLLQYIDESIDQIIVQANIPLERILGIGVGMHGIVDVKEGVSLYAPNLQLRNIPIKEHLEARYSTTVKLENDVRAMALGESWFGAGKNLTSVVCVNIGRGIGAGIIQNGDLFHGQHFIAGEIGHMTIDIDGPRCSCGNYGCLQALASGPAIAAKAAQEIAMGRESILVEQISGDLNKITGELIYQAAREDDHLSIEVLQQAGVYLGIGLTNLIHTLNPDRIIIGGGVSQSGNFILNSLKDTLNQRILTDQARFTEIRLSELGGHATSIGAATLLFQEVFSTEAAG